MTLFPATQIWKTQTWIHRRRQQDVAGMSYLLIRHLQTTDGLKIVLSEFLGVNRNPATLARVPLKIGSNEQMICSRMEISTSLVPQTFNLYITFIMTIT